MIAPASRHIGKYEIRQKLGRGGMADVYLAFDTIDQHEVALKLIEHAEDADTHDTIAAERRGAELQARLAEVDAHVAQIYGSGDVDGYFYVAMEYVAGQDLAELMRHGPLEAPFAVDAAIAVAGTLESAHNLQVTIDGKNYHGIVHGDIKPKNIRLDTRGQIRVLDFGIAKALSLSRRLTRNEFGSVPYSSPERLLDGQVDVQSDLWSLAVMLYEMVTGMQPYQADTTERLERMIRSRIPPPPAPDPCPDALRRILVKAMMPEPDQRYGSAREFADDLIMFRTGGPVRAIAEDLEATRRTTRPPRDDDDTRRTVPIEVLPPSEDTRRTAPTPDARKPDEILNWPNNRPAEPRKPMSKTGRRISLAIVAAAFLFFTWQALSSYVVYKKGQELAGAIATEQVTDPGEIWNRWLELSKDGPSSFYLSGVRNAVEQKEVDAANRVIASYRSTGAVYENGWRGAREELMHALQLDPTDSVRGRLRLVEGHISRVTGETRHRQSDIDDAMEKFTEAQRLLPGSPDPPLAEARLDIQDLKDYDRAYASLRDAEKHGYSGIRERQELADAYRDRANRSFWDSRNVRDLPQEKDIVERARDDYQRALDLYQSIASYGNSASSIESVQQSLDSATARLNEIEHPSTSPLNKLKNLLHLWQ
jgi:serine/threonine protein kinase